MGFGLSGVVQSHNHMIGTVDWDRTYEDFKDKLSLKFKLKS